MALRRFLPQEVLLSQQDAWDVLRFFFPQGMGTIPVTAITDEDRAFAQSLLVEAIDASCNVGYIEAAFRSFAGRIPGAFSLALFGMRAARNWFTYAKDTDLRNPQIYEVVRLKLQDNFGTSVWACRVNGLGYLGAYEP